MTVRKLDLRPGGELLYAMTAIDPRQTRRAMGRSIGALAAGFFVTAALSLGADVVMHGTGIFPGWGEPMSDGLFAWATAVAANRRGDQGVSRPECACAWPFGLPTRTVPMSPPSA